MKKLLVQYRQVFIISIIIGAVSLTGCSSEDESSANSLSVSVKKPVKWDYDAIKERGVLRMITRYSSNTYFLQQGIEWGFEYELVRKFAKEHGLALEVVIVGIDENPYDLLNSGEGDLIAANYAATADRRHFVDFTNPYNLVDQVVVYSDEIEDPPQSIKGLALSGYPVTVRRNSSYYHRIQDRWEEGGTLTVNLVSNEKDTEALLFDVSRDKYSVTVADENIFRASTKYMEGLVKGPTLARNDTIAWAVRKNAPELKKELNQFLGKHFKQYSESKAPKRSLFLEVLRRRYFEGGRQLAGYYSPDPGLQNSDQLSPYDGLIQEVADSTGLNWLMITSIIAQETKFNPKAKSWAGAMGLMQILPRYSSVADSMLLYDERINLLEGTRIIQDHLEHYAYIDSTEQQWSFALAAYNVGEGHLADARRLAIDLNKNPNNWNDVADALLKLMDRRYYQYARHGFCRGIETVRYVREVKSRYEVYKSIIAMRSGDSLSTPGVFGFFNNRP